ncbi:CD225/dispanin family protein [Pantoea ananatis]|uniref:CD225/dispanin family protein n=1 Tax=Pantoea ananas TaxID=553 RepID=UPI00221ED3FD|nr:CD225/dispanin family protein [Pantoea ananatis]
MQVHPPPPAPASGVPGPVPNHLAWAIISTVLGFCLCCPALITGIVAIVFSSKVNSLLNQGDLEGARRASNTAKTWCWVTTALAITGGATLLGAMLGLALLWRGELLAGRAARLLDRAQPAVVPVHPVGAALTAVPRFGIYSQAQLVGWSDLEFGDPPMGVAFGRFIPAPAYRTIQPRVVAAQGVALDALQLSARTTEGTSLAGSTIAIGDLSADLGDSGLEVSVLCVDHATYAQVFPKHVAAYAARLADKT